MALIDGDPPRRRRWDTFWGRVSWVWAHVVPAVAIGIAGWALIVIQGQRQESIRIQCEQSNARHAHTIATLNERIAELPSPEQRARAQASKDFTLALIDQLAPFRDCEKEVHRLAP